MVLVCVHIDCIMIGLEIGVANSNVGSFVSPKFIIHYPQCSPMFPNYFNFPQNFHCFPQFFSFPSIFLSSFNFPQFSFKFPHSSFFLNFPHFSFNFPQFSSLFLNFPHFSLNFPQFSSIFFNFSKIFEFFGDFPDSGDFGSWRSIFWGGGLWPNRLGKLAYPLLIHCLTLSSG